MESRHRPWILCFLGGLFLFEGPTVSSEIGGIPPKYLQYEVSVARKLVFVSARTSRDTPVMDLERSDFQLYDNGQVQEIVDFERHVQSKSQNEQAKTALKDLAPTIPGRKFLLLLDLVHNNLAGVGRSIDAMRHIVDDVILDNDEVGLLIYSSSRGLEFGQYLTRDKGKILKAIHEIEQSAGPTPAGLAQPSKRDESVRDERVSSLWDFLQITDPDAPLADYLNSTAAATAMDLEIQREAGFCASLAEAAGAFRLIPGPKHVILFSSGIPRYILENPTDALARDEYQRALGELDSSNCIIFALDSGSLASFLKSESSSQRPSSNPAHLRSDLSLKTLASSTGGQYLAAAGNVDKLIENVQQTTSNYYVLGYRVNETWDGKPHQIEVRTRRKSVMLQYQRQYYNPQSFDRWTNYERRLQLLDLATSTRSAFVSAEDIPCKELFYRLGPNCGSILISRLPDAMAQVLGKGPIEIWGFSFDIEGSIQNVSRGQIDPATLTASEVFAFIHEPCPVAARSYRIVARNLLTGRAARGGAIYTNHESPDKAISLDSLVLVTKARDAVYLRMDKAEDRERIDPVLSLEAFAPSISRFVAPILTPIPKSTKIIGAMVGIENTLLAAEETTVKLKFELDAGIPGQTPIPVRFSIISQIVHGQRTSIFVELELPEMKPGRFTVRVTATENLTEESDQQISYLDIF